MKVILEMLRAH